MGGDFGIRFVVRLRSPAHPWRGETGGGTDCKEVADLAVEAVKLESSARCRYNSATWRVKNALAMKQRLGRIPTVGRK
jgi:hypothetical protein